MDGNRKCCIGKNSNVCIHPCSILQESIALNCIGPFKKKLTTLTGIAYVQ